MADKKNIKNHPIPFAIFFLFLFFLVIGISSLDLLSIFLQRVSDGFFERLLSFVLCFVVFVIEEVFFLWVLNKFGKDKIYRGKGLYRFLTLAQILSVLTPIAIWICFVSMLMTMTLFNFLVLLMEMAIPFIMAKSIKEHHSLFRCRHCGALNALETEHCEMQDFGVVNKFHNEEIFRGGPTTVVSDGLYHVTEYSAKYKCKVCGNISHRTSHYDTKI